jgi:hypothetical protein
MALMCDPPTMIIGDEWSVSGAFRRGGALEAQPLLTATVGIPAPVILAHDHIVLIRVRCPGAPVLEGVDYTMDYFTGVLTPTTHWPAGVYTIDYSYYIVTTVLTKNHALGDMDFMVGGPAPHYGNLGEDIYGDAEMPVIVEQPLQIKVIPVP